MTANLAVDQTAIIGPEVVVPASVSQNARAEVVAGYVLEQRIGVGGYGEVWRAIGPGGLPKAVKILHGQHDGPQADAERKSLERMRGLRHPFLLNIERIEVIDDRLIIVTELAEGGLDARFEQVRRAGHRGIPRDELLGYMRDAADALDFLFDRHGLQHLDVKPSNLLLQGGHLKVADFGLIKDIRQAGVSLVGGFTPLYAPPELFEGRPCRSSDQYSLAIVYQMMLTGKPPFAGRTAAQLTAQHLNSPPDLTSLPLSDRPSITQALAKNPTARFENCRQFVDRLSERKPQDRRMRGSAGEARQPSADAPGSATASGDLSSSDTTRRIPAQLPKLAAVPLPPVSANPSATTYRRTVFLGIGGLGGRVLQSLRQKFADRFGGESSLPALPLLYLDTDPQAISASRAGDDGSALGHNETLAIPLREPKQYRANSGELLQWLSRRWLYNIPKSRQAEGIRPLGRLALVDHHQAVRDRIHQLVETAGSDEACRLTGETTGLKLENGPLDVVLIAAISGGTGSGAVLDAAYLVRDVLAKMHLEKATVSAILLTATGSRPQTKQLELANAVACLQELEQFSLTGGSYPGDATCQLPSFAERPFDSTHVVHLGDGLEPTSLRQEMEKVAEYLVRRAATPAHAFFEACRHETDSNAGRSGETACVKSFGVATHRAVTDDHALTEVESLCHALMQQWRGTVMPSPDGKPASRPEVAQRIGVLFGNLRLNTDQVAAMVTSMTQGELGQRIDTYFQAQWTSLLAQHTQAVPALGPLYDAIDREYSTQQPETQDAEHPAAILPHLQQRLHSSAQKYVQAIQAELLGLMDNSAARLDGACEALGDVVFRLDQTADNLLPLLLKIRGDLEQLKRAAAASDACGSAGGADFAGASGLPPEPVGAESAAALQQPADSSSAQCRSLCRRYFLLKFCEGIWLCWIRYLRTIRDRVSQTAPAIDSLRARLQELEDHFGRALGTPGGDPPSDGRSGDESAGPPALPVAGESLVREFDEQLRADAKIGLASLMSNDQNQGWKRVADAIRNEALAFLVRHGFAPDRESGSAFVAADEAASVVDAVTPGLSNVGGGRRVLAVVPNHTPSTPWTQKLADRFGNCVTLQPSSGGEFFFCCEVEGIATATVIDRLAHEHPTILEMAARLHTRIDVE